ncbi:chromosome segregation ATPase [Saccharopolyspora lacisalsi]|uniref:Chromosome segregation ATPase n=1 Tax=Halosaccharopolyspora lacisalsi TaxID=1000566 RepID=A0A839E243_9PSEU|nr:hypothetical protein [Halosaccharopolyspora lacisalsi]MBA8827924.1 chromosome segregation ATPase [Halosaccharopolyspora lacisalsi]
MANTHGQPHDTSHGTSSNGDAPTEHPEVLANTGGDETPDEKIRHLDQEQTKRLNAQNVRLTNVENLVTEKTGALERELKSLKASVDNNAASIRSFTDSINAARQAAQQAKKATDQLSAHVEQAIDAQALSNQEFDRKIQANSDQIHNTAEQANQALTDAVKTLNKKITDGDAEVTSKLGALEGEYRAHTHHFRFDGTTDAPAKPSK